jgi:eukaryotic-like serine/threonine-protein kinase
MGDVFLATDIRLGKLVALKLLKSSLMIGNHQDLVDRFERECAICAALKGAHIVQVSDYGVTAQGYPFYVMEYLQGQTLGQLLLTQSRLPIEQTCNIITQVCVGLHLAHRGVEIWDRGTNTTEHIKVIHRDLKPDNIFLVPSALGELVKIIDFGIAKIQSLQAEYTSATIGFMGTCHYASPEQVSGRKVDERSDIYNLGMILYEMLAGIDPFGLSLQQRRITSSAWLSAHMSTAPIPLRSQPNCAHLPPALEAVVMQCLEKSPAARFTSVLDLSRALSASTHQRADSSPRLAETAWRRKESSEELAAIPSLGPRSSSQRAWLIMTGVLLAVSLSVYSIPRLLRHSIQPEQLPTAISTATPAEAVQPLALVKTLSGNAEPVWSAVLSPDGQTVISAGAERDATGQYLIKLWDVATGRMVRTLSGHRDVVRSLSLSGDGQVLASGSDDRTVKLWNLTTGEVIRSFEGHTNSVWSVALSADGQVVVSGSEDATVRIWTVATGQSRRAEHSNTVYSVAVDPSGKTIASASADKTIKLWNVDTGELQRTLGEPGGHREPVSAVAFSPDGQQLASVGWDGFVKLWSAPTGQLLQTFEGHSDQVVAVAFVDLHTIASASEDNSIKLWDTQTEHLLQTLSGHSDHVLSVMSQGDRAFVSSSRDTTIKLWR